MLSLEVVSALVAVVVISRVLKFHSDRKKVLGLPGLRSIVTPFHPLGASLPTFSLNPGLGWQWLWRNQVYQRAGASTISVLAWVFGDPTIYTVSMKVARQVVSTRGQFVKTAETTAITTEFGHNLFAANNDDWRRQRRIMGPAFSVDLYNLLWRETADLFEEMVETEQWKNKAVVTLTPVNDITTKFALYIISRCAFGTSVAWDTDTKTGSVTDFNQALALAARWHTARLIIPNWMYRLPIPWFRNLDTAYKTLKRYVHALIVSRRAEIAGESDEAASVRHDLFSRMLGQNVDEGELALSDNELAGNIFLMLHAGHATAAHTLDAAIGFLAIHADIQEEVYEEIKSVYQDDPELSFDAHYKLRKTQACFLEAARLFPAGFMMIRQTTEDLVLATDDPHVYGGHLPLRKGTTVVVDLVGMHYNEQYFPEPEEFRPSRWYTTHENDLSMFSFGARACIGRKFALVEAVSFLSRLLIGWRIEPVLRDGETLGEWRRRIMVAQVTMTLGVGDVPVRLVARK